MMALNESVLTNFGTKEWIDSSFGVAECVAQGDERSWLRCVSDTWQQADSG